MSTVLAIWETAIPTPPWIATARTTSKVGASKLNGYMPSRISSFRSMASSAIARKKKGYRVAPVISGGELIDGLAGGMCQIASTLHAAAFFAGLGNRAQHAHSRPSVYIPMGLDSTVVYPQSILKLRNPYDFPVIIHYA